MNSANNVGSSWTFLTNHARVLIMIARDPETRLRDVATACDITERTAQAIVADLENAGYLSHTREGRRNRYQVTPETRFRHRAEADLEISGLLTLIAGDPEPMRGTRGEQLESWHPQGADQPAALG